MISLFDWTLQLNGFPIFKAKKKIEEIVAVSKDNYALFTEKRKRFIVEYHIKNNPFYKDLMSKKGLDFHNDSLDNFNWDNLPIMQKIDFQKNLKDRIATPYKNKSYYINKTSGSSGDPMVFAKDKLCHALIWANIERCFNWHSIDYNHSLQARFYGMPLGKLNLLKLRIKDWLSNRYRFSIFDLSDSGIAKIIAVFSKKKFVYINGYTSTLVQIGLFLKEKKMVLKTICPTLELCITTSEMLFDDDRKLLEENFGVPVINEYGASEVDLIAFENQDKKWLINTETIFVEIVDENNKPLPYGETGKILITSLYNFAHPFIRYEVGDMGCISKKSDSKTMILEKLLGRTNDIAVLPSGKRAPGMTFYSITKQLFADDGNVKEFVIKQTKTDTFEIIYVAKNAFSNEEKQKIALVFDAYLEPNLKYIFIKKDSIERNKSGKLKQFVSMVK